MKIWIKQISHYLPENIVTNDDLIKIHNIRMKSGWVEKIIGIKERRWAKKDEAVSDLALKSCNKLDLTTFNGSMFLSTVTGDFLTPSTSSIIKKKLGFKDQLPTYDINSACAGLIFAMEAAMNRLIATKENESLVMASECRSRFVNTNDRRTAFIFGDAACSLVLEKNDHAPGEIEWIISKTIPSSDYEIYIPGGGTRLPLNKKLLEKKKHLITMNDGTKISEVTKKELVTTILTTLDDKGLSLKDFDHFIFHQGNGLLIKAIGKELGVPLEKLWINFDKYGNSSSASVGVSLSESYEKGALKKGQKVLLVAMGAGYHCGISSIIWGLD